MGKCMINGVEYDIPNGSSITVVNNIVIVDGKILNAENPATLKIEIHGNINELSCDKDVVVEGDVGWLTSKGSVQCKNVTAGSVEAGGSVNCGDVDKSVDAGGSVNCGRVGGNVKAGGSVRHG